MVRGLDTNVTSNGLTVVEEDLFEKNYKAELACNRVLLCKNEIEKFQRVNLYFHWIILTCLLLIVVQYFFV